MYNIVKSYVSVMKKEDIRKFATKNNLIASNEEIDFIYDFIKNIFGDLDLGNFSFFYSYYF